MKINFYGAVDSVTGSCHLIQFNEKKILLDCGQFQGSSREEKLNFSDFEFNPSEIDYVFLSHSHIDHCGRIPLLVKRGFKGQIICVKPTYDLCKIMLLDSAHIHESDAEWYNRKAKRAGKKIIEPLYSQEDAQNCMKYFKTCLYEQTIDIDDDLTVRFTDAGHILGSSIIELWVKENNSVKPTKIVFSGDIGTENRPILNNPNNIDKADYLIMESTYGNRKHEEGANKIAKLIDIILKTAKRGGNVVIPSFAVGRTQEIIYELNKVYDNDKDVSEELKKIPVYIDSPLAMKTTEIFRINSQVFDEETMQFVMKGNDPLEFKNLHFVQSTEESKELNFDNTPKIIISASGMCDAGRIRHHLKHNLWRPESSIVFVGYQAENTLGRRLLDGEKRVKIFGEEINVSAEIHEIDGFSGHADRDGLLKWLSSIKSKPEVVFLVHGEQDAKISLAKDINELNINCLIAEKNKDYIIEHDKMSVYERIMGIDKIPKSMIKAELNQIESIKKRIKKLNNIFDNAILLTDKTVSDKISIDKCNKINNQLIEIENEIMSLMSLSGK